MDKGLFKFMRRLAICAFTVSLFLIPVKSWAQTNVNEDYLYLIDISGSVIGLPRGSGNENIWENLKRVICAKVESLPLGVRVIIVPFDMGARREKVREFVISSEEDRTEVKRYINTELPNEDNPSEFGEATWITHALDYSLGRLNELQQEPRHTQVVYLFSDTRNTGPGSPPLTWRDIARKYQIEEAEASRYLYIWAYVPEGVVSQLDRKSVV